MQTAVTKVFRNGNSEAVRLPKGLGFGEGVDVRLVRVGDTLTIRPVYGEHPNAALVARLRALTQPGDPVEEREPFTDPERPGLL